MATATYSSQYTPASTGSSGGTISGNIAQETGGKLAAIDAKLAGTLNTAPPSSTLVDVSGALAAADVAQTVMAARGARRGFSFQNNSTADMWINLLGGAATKAAPALRIAAGAYYETPVGGCWTAAVSVIGSTVGQSYTALEW